MGNQILLRLIRYTRPYKKYILLTLLTSAIGVLLTLLIPVLIGRAVDGMIGAQNVNFSRVIKLILMILAAALVSSFFTWLSGVFSGKITFLTASDLRKHSIKKLNTLPIKYIDNTPHGEIINKVVNDIDVVSEGLLQGINQLFSGMITIVGTLAFMLLTDFWIALIVALITPLSIFVAAALAKRTRVLFTEQSKIQAQLSAHIEEMLSNQKLVQAFGYQSRSIEQYQAINKRLQTVGVSAQFASALTNPSTRFVNGIVYAAVGLFGALAAVGGRISVGQLSCFLSYANQYTKPFNEISGVLAQLQSAIASAERVFDLIDQIEQIDDGTVQLDTCYGNFEFIHVAFSYHNNQKLITDLNLSIPAGTQVAIVGPTGCGKTTLINLLMRFYDVTSGEIRMDDVPIPQIKRDSYLQHFGMILQESWLSGTTILENIRFGKPDADYDAVVAAAKASYAHPFIEKLPDGYDTIVDENASNISQGQKQLICIARAMLTNPTVLILDEATSNIDTRTEVHVNKAFRKLMQGRTCFIVAHRLSTILDADLILVMKDGDIIETGSHETLMANNGFYATLYRARSDTGAE